MLRSHLVLGSLLLLGACKDKDSDSVEDGTITDTTPQEVAWSLSVSGPESGVAGEALTWEATVQTESGAPLDATVAMAIVDADGATAADGADLTATLTAVGTYAVTVTAEVDGESKAASLELDIAADALSALTLELSSTSAEINESISATVAGTDSYGNPVELDPSLSADPADGVSISGLSATFSADGAYTFTAQSDGQTATAGPVYVDGAGPLVILTSPARGAWIEGDAATIEGVVTDAVSGAGSLTLNEEAVTLSKDGSFSHAVDLTSGPNLLSFAAVDLDGNASDMVVGVIAGAFSEDALEAGIETHLNQDGLDAIAEVLVDELDISALESSLKAANPIATASLGCVDVEVDVDGLAVDAPTAEVTPTSSGLSLVLEIADLDIDLGIDVDLCGWSSASTSGELTADQVDIEVELSLAVDGPGDVDVTIDQTTVTFTNYAEDFGTLSSLLSSFGYTLSDLGIDSEGIVEDALVDAIEDAVPGALEEALESVRIDSTLALVDAEADLFAEIGALETSSDGLTLVLDAEVSSGATHPDVPAHPGSLILGGDAPDYASTPGLFLGLSLDVLNRTLEQLWNVGGVHATLTSDDLGLEPALVGLVFPDNTALTLILYPQLPPILTPASGKAPMALDIPELQVEIWGDADPTAPLTTAAIHLTAGATPAVSDSEIALEISDAALTLDIISASAETVGADESLEGLLSVATSGLAESLLPEIAFELPAMGGFEMSPQSIEAAGDDGDWIAVGADLSLQ